MSASLGGERGRLTPLHAFGVDLEIPVVALDFESLSYLQFVGATASFVSVEEQQPMRFFSPFEGVGRVDCVAFCSRRVLIAAFCTVKKKKKKKKKKKCLVYGIGHYEKKSWVPSLMEEIALDLNGDVALAAFAPTDPEVVVCLAGDKCLGLNWRLKTVVFSCEMGAGPVSSIAFHAKPTELSTAGARLQLWRQMGSNLKPRVELKQHENTGGYATHAWLGDAEVVVAALKSGSLEIICHQKNEVTQHLDDGGVQRTVLKIVELHGGGALVGPRKGGFATVDAAAEIRVFEEEPVEDDGRRSSKIFVRYAFLRKLSVGVPSLRGVALFPQTTALLLTGEDRLWSFDVDAALLGAVPEVEPRALTPHYHAAAATSLTVATAKTTICSVCPGDGLILWDWTTLGTEVRFAAPEFTDASRIVCASMHPSGHELVLGLTDEIRVFDIGHGRIHEAAKHVVKGVVSLKNDATPLVASQNLSEVRFSHSGHLLACVLGRLVLVFSTRPERLALTHCLRGHASTITSLIWRPDDRRLWTAATNDGAMYEWLVGDFKDSGRVVSRAREIVTPGVCWSHLASFAETSETDGLVACGMRADTPVLCVWKSAVEATVERPDGAQTSFFEPRAEITSMLAVEPMPGAPNSAVLLCGTREGTLAVYPWAGKALGDLKSEISVCRLAVSAVAFAADGDHLCVAGLCGGVVLLHLHRDLGHGADALTVAKHLTIATTLVGGVHQLAKRGHRRRIHNDDKEPKQQQRSELVFAPKSHLEAQEEEIRQLESALAEAKQLAKEEQPKRHHLLGEMEAVRGLKMRLAHSEEVIEALETKAEVDESEAKRRFAEQSEEFESAFASLEAAYDRKLAVEAARYSEVELDVDRLQVALSERTADARKAVETQRLEHDAKITALARSKDAEITALGGFLAEMRSHYEAVGGEEATRHDQQVLESRESRLSAIATAEKNVKAVLQEKSVLKKINQKILENQAKLKDELTEKDAALTAARERGDNALKSLHVAKTAASVESGRAAAFKAKLATASKKLDEMERLSAVLKEQASSKDEDVQNEKRRLLLSNSKSRKLDAVLEVAGKKSALLLETQQRNNEELKRLQTHASRAETHLATNQRRTARLADHLELLLRKQEPVLPSDLWALHAFMATEDRELLCLEEPNVVVVDGSLPEERVTRRQQKLRANNGKANLAAEATIHMMRQENTVLMKELNGIRFDRTSLYRKLRDAHFQLKFKDANEHRPLSPFLPREPLPAILTEIDMKQQEEQPDFENEEFLTGMLPSDARHSAKPLSYS